MSESDILEEIDKVMDDFVDFVFGESQENLVRPHTKIFKSGASKTVVTTDRANLLRSGNVNREFLNKKIVYSAPYATDVEFGNDGIPVTAESLELWVKRKILKRKPDN